MPAAGRGRTQRGWCTNEVSQGSGRPGEQWRRAGTLGQVPGAWRDRKRQRGGAEGPGVEGLPQRQFRSPLRAAPAKEGGAGGAGAGGRGVGRWGGHPWWELRNDGWAALRGWDTCQDPRSPPLPSREPCAVQPGGSQHVVPQPAGTPLGSDGRPAAPPQRWPIAQQGARPGASSQPSPGDRQGPSTAAHACRPHRQIMN